jgi:hypothetical protein
MLVAARALQGAFGAVLGPSALGTLVSTFRDRRERGRAFGVFGSVAAAGGGVGLQPGVRRYRGGRRAGLRRAVPDGPYDLSSRARPHHAG